MTQEKRAELYTNPGGKFIRSNTLSRILGIGVLFDRRKSDCT